MRSKIVCVRSKRLISRTRVRLFELFSTDTPAPTKPIKKWRTKKKQHRLKRSTLEPRRNVWIPFFFVNKFSKKKRTKKSHAVKIPFVTHRRWPNGTNTRMSVQTGLNLKKKNNLVIFQHRVNFKEAFGKNQTRQKSNQRTSKELEKNIQMSRHLRICKWWAWKSSVHGIINCSSLESTTTQQLTNGKICKLSRLP